MSNPIVIRILQKCLLFIALGMSAALLLVVVAGQVAQRIYRSRAELLLSDVQSLELNRTPWLETQRQFKRWAGQSTFNGLCDDTECTVQITLLEIST